MYIRVLIFFLFVNTICIQAQNLVRNPSFEDTLFCPPGSDYLWAYEFWDNPNQGATPDAFHVNNCSGINWQFFIPTNILGHAQTRTGDAYAGIINWSLFPGEFNYKEHAQGRLIKTLDTNVVYCGGFYSQLADISFGPVDGMGMYLNDSSLNIPSFPYTPIVYDPNPYIDNPINNYLSDTTNWMLMEQSFSAIGNERFVIIGNMKTYPNTNYIFNDSTSGYSYYYIDDVFLFEQKPVFIKGNDTIVCDTSINSQIALYADNAVHYIWYPLNDSTNILSTKDSLLLPSPSITTSYVVKGTACGFVSYDTVTVSVTICEPDNIVLPNFISPNGDGKNDLYFINAFLPQGSKLTIFNRWGNEVYSSNDYQNDWDGTYMGNLLPTSTYFSVLELPNGTRKSTFIELVY